MMHYKGEMESKATQAGLVVVDSGAGKKKRVDWWAVATGAWIVVVLGLAVVKGFWNMELNSMGDYVAGAFAPPALIWLVRGYYQQGKALEVQLAELKQSVSEFGKQTEQFSAQTELMRVEAEAAGKARLVGILDRHVGQVPNQLLPVFEAFREFGNFRSPIDGETIHGFRWSRFDHGSDPTRYKQTVDAIIGTAKYLKSIGIEFSNALENTDLEKARELRTKCRGLQEFWEEGMRYSMQLGSEEWVQQTKVFGLPELVTFIYSKFGKFQGEC